MADIVNVPSDPYTSEQVIFTSGGVAAFNSANYHPTTGIGRGQGARVVFMNLESDAGAPSIRYKITGSAPAAASGMLWLKGAYITMDSPVSIQNFQGICSGAGEVATAVVFYYF